MIEDYQEQEEDLSTSFTTVRGSMCKLFRSEHRPDRVKHKALGVIHPVPEYNDPRTEKRELRTVAKFNAMSLFDFSKKYREKSFLPEHLTTPFIYIERVVTKGNDDQLLYAHPDQWNKSNNVNSTRVQTQIPKKELSELTRSIVKSKREEGDRNDYEQNERAKKYVKMFFKQITQLLSEKRFAQDVAKELMKSKDSQANKKQKIITDSNGRSVPVQEKATSATKQQQQQQQQQNKKQSTKTAASGETQKKQTSSISTTSALKEFIELDRDYSLREIWLVFCKVRKVECHDDQEIVDLKVFQEFLREGLGYLEKKWSEIDKYYDYFNKKEDVGFVHPKQADRENNNNNNHNNEGSDNEDNNNNKDEHDNNNDDHNDYGSSPLKTKTDFMYNSSLLQWRPMVKKIDKSMFSMRAFIFNYEKFLKDANKISYVLSERAASERKVSLKHAVTSYFTKYPEQKEQINESRDYEDECKLVIKGIASEYDDPDVKREMGLLNDLEETSKQGHRFSKEEKNQLNVNIALAKEKVQAEMEKFNELYQIAIDQLTNLFNDRDRIFFEKRIIMRYLRRVIGLKEHLVLTSVDNEVGVRLDDIEEEMVVIGTFYDQFMIEKESYGEKALKLVELATYIHENNLSRPELERIAYFVKKLKSNYNVSRGQEKGAHIDPNQFISISLLVKTYTIFKEKREHEKEVLQNLVDTFASTMDAKMPLDTNQRVRAKIEVNLIYDTFVKIMEDYNEQLELSASKIMNLINFILADEARLPKTYKNFLGYLIWGIYDRCDEYLPLEIKEKILSAEAIDESQSKRTRNTKNKSSGGNTFNGDIFSVLKDDDDDDKKFLSRVAGSNNNHNNNNATGQNRRNSYMAHSEEEDEDDIFGDHKKGKAAGNHKAQRGGGAIDDDEEFAIEALNRRNNNNNNNAQNKQGNKLPFLNENDLSRISDYNRNR